MEGLDLCVGVLCVVCLQSNMTTIGYLFESVSDPLEKCMFHGCSVLM